MFGEKFNPADPDFDRAAVVSYTNKVAQQSSQNKKKKTQTSFYLLSLMTMKNCYGQVLKEHLMINLPLSIRLFYLSLFNLLKKRANIQRMPY